MGAVDTASIATFIRTGILGPLGIGVAGHDVRALLGLPDTVGRGFGNAVIEQYAAGRLELTFSKGRIVLIALFPFRGGELRGLAVVDDLPSGVRESSQLFKQWLTQEGLQFDVIDEDAGSCALHLPFGSTVTFEEGSLYTVQRT
jgi:hypothetical protein